MQRRLGLAAALLALVTSVACLGTTAYGGTAVAPNGRQVAAQQALVRVRGLFDGTSPTSIPGRSGRDGTEADPSAAPDATVALRDLAQLRADLPAAEQTEAARILARPTDPTKDGGYAKFDTAEQTPVCSPQVCVHYVLKAGDKDTVDPTDTNADGVPDFVATTLATFSHVDQTYVDAGYRAPKSDGTRGGDARPDIYLANIGYQGLYGYCTSDVVGSPATTWAYCVVDNDFSRGEFPRHTPVQNLEVTAAHEFFHAVQFGYDYGADAWFMEATATWAEDELYDAVNDNRQYLRSSPLRRPDMSMDQFTPRGLFHYGTWIFFRYLTERLPATAGGLPTLVREMWRRDDAAPGGAHEYSLRAIASALKTRGLSLANAFTGFAQANLVPGRSYREGKAYPSAPLTRTTRVAPRTARATAFDVRLDHLTSATVRYQPTADLTGTWKLHLDLDMADRAKGSAAVITILPKGKAPRTVKIGLDAAGNALRTVDFSRARTAWVEVTLVNAGTRYDCGGSSNFSCRGRSLDDNLAAHLGARASR